MQFTKVVEQTIVTFYRPPNVGINNFRKVLTSTRETNGNVIMLGDLNAPDIQWSTKSGKNQLSNELCNDVSDANLTQMNTLPSREYKSNILDVVLTNSHDCCSAPIYYKSYMQSDHHAFQLTMACKISRSKSDSRWLYD